MKGAATWTSKPPGACCAYSEKWRILLRRDKTCRAGIKGKRLHTCLKEDYLLRILGQGI